MVVRGIRKRAAANPLDVVGCSEHAPAKLSVWLRRADVGASSAADARER